MFKNLDSIFILIAFLSSLIFLNVLVNKAMIYNENRIALTQHCSQVIEKNAILWKCPQSNEVKEEN